MQLPFGHTRSRVSTHYAFISPDTHVWSTLPGWTGSSFAIHISPHMGSRFTQATIKMAPGGRSAMSLPGVQRFVYVLSGAIEVESIGLKSDDGPLIGKHRFESGGFVFFPADHAHSIRAREESVLVLFEKPYEPMDGIDYPELVSGQATEIASSAFMGDDAAQLKLLLPNIPSMDMAVNLFTYQPGAALPQVEIHVMEHGLIMTGGTGVYRLGDDWFPVQTGDIIWMASYCPQWFVAMGKQPASYLYYKDINRDPLA
jgi:(S)-ureidoglycine aminohydrolase